LEASNRHLWTYGREYTTDGRAIVRGSDGGRQSESSAALVFLGPAQSPRKRQLERVFWRMIVACRHKPLLRRGAAMELGAERFSIGSD